MLTLGSSSSTSTAVQLKESRQPYHVRQSEKQLECVVIVIVPACIRQGFCLILPRVHAIATSYFQTKFLSSTFDMTSAQHMDKNDWKLWLYLECMQNHNIACRHDHCHCMVVKERCTDRPAAVCQLLSGRRVSCAGRGEPAWSARRTAGAPPCGGTAGRPCGPATSSSCAGCTVPPSAACTHPMPLLPLLSFVMHLNSKPLLPLVMEYSSRCTHQATVATVVNSDGVLLMLPDSLLHIHE